MLVGQPRQIDAVAARIVTAVEARDDGRGHAAVDPADVLRWLDGFEEVEHQSVVPRRLSDDASVSLGCGGLLLLAAAAVALGCGIADNDDGLGVGMLLMIPGVLLMLPGLVAVGDLSQRRQRMRRITVRADADGCEVARDGRPRRRRNSLRGHGRHGGHVGADFDVDARLAHDRGTGSAQPPGGVTAATSVGPQVPGS